MDFDPVADVCYHHPTLTCKTGIVDPKALTDYAFNETMGS